MALQMRPNCEFFDKDVAPDSEEARARLFYTKEEIAMLTARLESVPPAER